MKLSEPYYFPNPMEQALAVLDAVDNDWKQAVCFAKMNVDSALPLNDNGRALDFWCSVVETLLPKEKPEEIN